MQHVGSNEGILYELFLFIGVLWPIFNQHPAVFVMPYTNFNPGPSFVDGFKKVGVRNHFFANGHLHIYNIICIPYKIVKITISLL